MRRFFPLLLVPVLACAKIGGFLDDDDGNGGGGMINTNMSFFVTSRPARTNWPAT